MTASISFNELHDDGPAVLERLASHPEGIVVSYEGSDVARLVPLGAEERAWRDALMSEGIDPNEASTQLKPTDLHLVPAEPVMDEQLESMENAFAEPAEEPAQQRRRRADHDPIEALTPLAFPVDPGPDAA